MKSHVAIQPPQKVIIRYYDIDHVVNDVPFLCCVKTTTNIGGEGFKLMVEHLLIEKDCVTQLQKLIESLHYTMTNIYILLECSS